MKDHAERIPETPMEESTAMHTVAPAVPTPTVVAMSMAACAWDSCLF